MKMHALFTSNPSPTKILHHIKRHDVDKEYTYIILGRLAPTGKTWLYIQLKELGFSAIELSETICGLVNYNGDRNHMFIDDDNKTVTIVLNRRYLGEHDS